MIQMQRTIVCPQIHHEISRTNSYPHKNTKFHQMGNTPTPLHKKKKKMLLEKELIKLLKRRRRDNKLTDFHLFVHF